MARSELRGYIREIAELIERGAIAESIAHCRHILKTFPKYLEAYRLLGKAYLEARRFDEAGDILGRVAAAVPNDFVAHVGLGIVADERGDLDEAIRHMQRAFEAQPSNAAVQTELQRLYGRRDGVVPPKIRMTRGALAHMYLQGDLQPQAISEIRSVLAQEPGRKDLQILLALAYFRAGQAANASEICTHLLAEYPYGLDANRLMAEMLSPREPKERRELYRRRVSELDPYAAFSKEPLMRSEAVPDSKIHIDRLRGRKTTADVGRRWLPADALPGAPPAGDAWIPAPVAVPSLRVPAVSEPTGLEGEASGPAAQEAAAAPLEQPGEWTPEPQVFATPAEAAASLVPADLPAWLREQMPSSAELAAEQADAIDGGLTEQVSGVESALVETSGGPAASDDIPGWLRELGSESPDLTSSPAWAADTSGAGPESVPQQDASSAVQGEPLEFGAFRTEEQADVVSWLQSLDAEPAGTDAQPGAAGDDGGGEALKPLPPSPTVPEPTEAEASTEEWLRSLEERTAPVLPEHADAQGPAGDWQRSFPKPTETERLATEDTDTSDSAAFPGAKDITWPASHAADADAATPSQADLGGAADAETLTPSAEETSPHRPPDEVAAAWPTPPTPAPEAALPSSETALPGSGGEETVADLAEWLAGLDGADGSATDQPGREQLADWLAAEEVPPAAQPTAPSDWRPMATDSAQPIAEVHAGAAPEPRSAAPKPPRSADEAALAAAQQALQRGDLPTAIESYARLIRKARFLEESIRDLRESVYRYPVDVGLWQTLGDAYMRANRLQEALDAYNKAEELIR